MEQWALYTAMEDEPRRKRLKLSLTKTKKRPSHESTSVGAAIGGDDDEKETAVATAVCGHDLGSATATEAVSELNEAGDDSSPFEPKPEPTSYTAAAASAVEERREAYYSANFKSILTTVLSDSPERHVISEDGSKVVKQFMELPGMGVNLWYLRLRVGGVCAYCSIIGWSTDINDATEHACISH